MLLENGEMRTRGWKTLKCCSKMAKCKLLVTTISEILVEDGETRTRSCKNLGKNSGKSFRKFRNTIWVLPLWWNVFRSQEMSGLVSLPSSELTWTLGKSNMAGGAAYQCSACGFVSNAFSLFYSINAAIVFVAKLRAVQTNCSLFR